jgi:hypothetical protein
MILTVKIFIAFGWWIVPVLFAIIGLVIIILAIVFDLKIAKKKIMNTKEGSTQKTAEDFIHNWFGLSYAQYLTIPRSVLQSMPDEWQERFVKCLEELDESIEWRPKSGRYWVKLKDENGRYVTDPLMDYERGRRRIQLQCKTTQP